MIKHLPIFILFGLTTIASLAAPAFTNSNQAIFTPPQKTAIQKIVHDYLIQHPEVLVEATRALQAKEASQQNTETSSAITAEKKALFNDPMTPTAGNPNGTVYIVEFFDYQCGHCRSVANIVKTVLAKNPNVKWFFKELPIFGDESKYAAVAALAANQQGQYLPFHNALFAVPDGLSKETVNEVAQNLHLDVSALTTEMQKPSYEAAIQANFALAQKLGIMGTPAFVISNKAETQFQFIPGATDEQGLQTAIRAVQTQNT